MQKRNDQKRITRTNFEMKNAKFAKIVNFAKIEINASFDVNFAEINVKMKNAFSECLHTISDTQIERDENFNDVKDEKFIKFANIDKMINVEIVIFIALNSSK